MSAGQTFAPPPVSFPPPSFGRPPVLAGPIISGPVVSGPAASPPPVAWLWEADGKGGLILYRQGRPVGGWSSRADEYFAYDCRTEVWDLTPRRPPVPLPPRAAEIARAAMPPRPPETKKEPSPEVKGPTEPAHEFCQVKDGLLDFGCNYKPPAAGTSYWLCGRPCTRAEAFKAVADSVPDDSKKNRLTVIGGKEECAAVEKDLGAHPALAAVKDTVLFREYRPDEFDLAKVGFVCTGKPTVYLQAPSGKVLHRSGSYPGPELLAKAIRKADPSYDPAKDPDLTSPSPYKPSPQPGPGPLPLPTPGPDGSVSVPQWALWVGAAALLFLVFRNFAQGQPSKP